MNYYLLIVTCALVMCAAISDITTGKIKNIFFLFFIAISLPLQIFMIIAKFQGGGVYFVNLLFSIVFAILFYEMGFWAAADSKLMITIAVSFPVFFYWNSSSKLFPALSLFLVIISVTYIYIIADTVINTLFHWKDCWMTLKKTITKDNTKSFVKRWFVIIFFSTVLRLFFTIISIPYAVSILLVFFALMCAEKQIIILSTCWIGFALADCVLWYVNRYDFITVLSICFITILLYFLGRFIQVFNYKIIRASDVRKGMIISSVSIKILEDNGVVFDKNMDESMNSRLSEEEAFNIKKTGIDFVRIVRKIPMAVFSALSFFIYVIMRFAYAS